MHGESFRPCSQRESIGLVDLAAKRATLCQKQVCDADICAARFFQLFKIGERCSGELRKLGKVAVELTAALFASEAREKHSLVLRQRKMRE